MGTAIDEIEQESVKIELPEIKITMINTSAPAVEELADYDDEAIIKRSTEKHSCGHRHNGVKGYKKCQLPCLNSECLPKDSNPPSADELCAICYTCELGSMSCVKLGCGHVFHADCILQLL